MTDHRDYKRIEAASGDELRDKLNKSFACFHDCDAQMLTIMENML